MGRNIPEWLDGLGLDRYAGTFADNEIDMEALPHITEEDLKELGVALGARRKMLAAIAHLGGTTEPATYEDRPFGTSPRAAAERRRLTVMFCDLVGSTALASQMDPEDYRDLLGVYRSAVSKATQKYDGYIAAHMGDGLLIYFGYPQAHEDDPERAVRAGLDVVEQVNGARPANGGKLQVRVGIATGLVVAGDMLVDGAEEERSVLGETPNLAARLQGIAEPNTVVLSDSTRQRVEGRFVMEALEPQSLKGIAEPVIAYRAIAVIEASRFEAVAARGLVAMAGRESELMLLKQRWEQTRLGEGQVVLLGGEPGIGKSRVSEELRALIRTETETVQRYQCSPYHTDSAFHPVIDHLHRLAKIAPNEPVELRRQKINTLVAETLLEHEAAASLLNTLLSLSPGDEALRNMTPQRQKAETIGVLVELLECWSAQGPVLIIFEDAHWIDPSTREVLDGMIARVQSLKALCLITHRPEFSPPWSGGGHVTTLSLNRLGRTDVNRIVKSVTGGANIPEELLERIVERTDGVPLFVEELTKTVLESEILKEDDGHFVLVDPLPDLSVPATLHDSLIARLDRLAPVKEVAQTAACIGRTFSPELLVHVLAVDKTKLDDALTQLVEAELVFKHGAGVQTDYSFKHALVRDAAYESVLVSKRQRVHARIAEALEEIQAETPGGEPELIARHYTIANMPEKAILFWMAAGRRALAGSNLVEANSHFSKALEQTSKIASPSDRATIELDVRTALGTAKMALFGWPAPEVRDVVEIACDLFEQGYGSAEAFMNLWNLWVHHGCRAEHADGLAVIERMLNHADADKDPTTSLVSSFAASMANLWVGNYAEALKHETRALELYDFQRDKDLVWNYNHDPKNTLLSWASFRVWALGYPDQARTLSDQALTHARKVDHAFNLCWTLGNSSIVFGLCGDFDTSYARIDELRCFAQEQELIFIQAYMAPATLCVLSAQEGGYQTSYDEGAQAEQVWHSIGGRFWSPFVRAVQAQACLHLNRSDEAQELVTSAINQVESTGEFMLAEEIYRIGGLVRLKRDGDRAGASTLFQKSLNLSRKHGTRSFELRTAVSSARLMRAQGQRKEAIGLLTSVYDQFTEGHDTADLKEAKAVLKTLRQA